VDETKQQLTDNETRKHIMRVRDFLSEAIVDLVIRVAKHDKSKLEEPEASVFAEFTPKLKGVTYGSDQYNEYLQGMGVALGHHYAVNPHHPEHWGNGVDGMTLIDLLEMICDWAAATERHENGDIVVSIAKNTERFGLSPQLAQILLNTVTTMKIGKRKGE